MFLISCACSFVHCAVAAQNVYICLTFTTVYDKTNNKKQLRSCTIDVSTCWHIIMENFIWACTPHHLNVGADKKYKIESTFKLLGKIASSKSIVFFLLVCVVILVCVKVFNYWNGLLFAFTAIFVLEKSLGKSLALNKGIFSFLLLSVPEPEVKCVAPSPYCYYLNNR